MLRLKGWGLMRKNKQKHDVIDYFLGKQRNAHTEANYRSDIRSLEAWFNPWKGDEDCMEVAKYVRYLIQGERLALTTVRERMGRIRRIYAALVEDGFRGDNPVDLSSVPKVRDRRQPKAPDLDELHRLGRVVDIHTSTGLRDAVMIGLALFEALRVHEIAGLNIGDVERCHGGIRLTVRGKGGTLDTIDCLVPMVSLLDRYMKMVPTSKANDPLFTNNRMPRQRLTTRGIRFIFDGYFRAAKFRRGLSCHSLRACHATTLAARGFPLTFIARRLRHSSIEHTLSYLADCPGIAASAMPDINRVFEVNLGKGGGK